MNHSRPSLRYSYLPRCHVCMTNRLMRSPVTMAEFLVAWAIHWSVTGSETVFKQHPSLSRMPLRSFDPVTFVKRSRIVFPIAIRTTNSNVEISGILRIEEAISRYLTVVFNHHEFWLLCWALWLRFQLSSFQVIPQFFKLHRWRFARFVSEYRWRALT